MNYWNCILITHTHILIHPYIHYYTQNTHVCFVNNQNGTNMILPGDGSERPGDDGRGAGGAEVWHLSGIVPRLPGHHGRLLCETFDCVNALNNGLILYSYYITVP